MFLFCVCVGVWVAEGLTLISTVDISKITQDDCFLHWTSKSFGHVTEMYKLGY